MQSLHLLVVAFASMGGAISVQGTDPGGTIEVVCASDTVGMAAITDAVERSHYWAPQTARRRMLSLARQACDSGAVVATFVPPPDQRWCQTAPTWSTLCLDRTAMTPKAPDLYSANGRSARSDPDVTPTVEIAP